MSEDTYISSLKRRFDYPAWQHAHQLDAELHVWRFALAGGELRGLRPERIEPAAPPPPAMTVPLQVQGTRASARGTREPARPPAEPRLTKSFWRPELRPRALISIDVYECASRAAAHELLLRILGGFQSSQLARREDLGLGDVVFAMPGGGALAFARGNLVHLVLNASRETVDVTEVARELDQHLISRPPAAGRAVRAPADAATGFHRLRATSATDRAAEVPLYLKVFSTAGSLHEEGDVIVLHPTDDKATYELGVVAVYPNRRQLQRTQHVGRTTSGKG